MHVNKYSSSRQNFSILGFDDKPDFINITYKSPLLRPDPWEKGAYGIFSPFNIFKELNKTHLKVVKPEMLWL